MEILLGILAILGGSGGIAGILTAVKSAKKADVDALCQVVKTLQEDYARLDKENDELRCEIKTMKAQYADLERRYNHVLVWATKRGYKPPEDDAG